MSNERRSVDKIVLAYGAKIWSASTNEYLPRRSDIIVHSLPCECDDQLATRPRAEIILSKPVFRGGTRKRARVVTVQNWSARRDPKMRGTAVATGGVDRSNVCSPIHNFRLRHRKFSIIWPGSRVHRIRSRAFFTGGYSTLTFGTGRRKLRRPSHNSSNKVSSKKNRLRMAKYSTTSLHPISPLFSNRHHQGLIPMTSDETQWFARIESRPDAETAQQSALLADSSVSTGELWRSLR